MKPSSLVVTFLCTIFLMAPASAQISIDTFGQWSVQTGLTNTMAATIKSAGRGAGNKASSPAPRVTFKPSSDTNRRTQLALIGIVGKTDANAAKELEQIFRTNDIVAMFDEDMRGYDLSSSDLPDTMAAFIVANWMIANKADLPDPSHVKAVRDNIARGMGQALGRLKNDQRQMIAEMLVYQTMFSIGARTSAQGSPAKMAALSDQAYQTMLTMGVDARKYQLTTQGMVPK